MHEHAPMELSTLGKLQSTMSPEGATAKDEFFAVLIADLS